jgi:hypothetical protein
MSEQKQYKRISNSLDRQIIGESSNGINISKDGNTFLFSGNNEEYLQALRSGSISSDKGEIATNDPNNVSSFIGMYKQGGASINLGNPNQQSLNINNQPAKAENIVTPAVTITPTPLPSVEPTPTPTPTPTVTPTPVGPVEEDIQDFKFEELPDQEGFQLFLEQEIGEFEEDNPDMEQPSSVSITGVTGGPTGIGGGGGGFLQPGLGTILNVATSKVGASAYPGPPDFKAAGYQNGNLPMSALIGVGKGGRGQYVYNGTGGWYLLHPEAARQYLALLQLGKSNNIKWTLTSAYRDINHQRSLGSGRTVAKPGGSPHGWAIAIDISELHGAVTGGVDKGDPAANARVRATNPLYQWFATNAPKYGFYNPYRLADGRGVDEVWHWEYWGFFVK